MHDGAGKGVADNVFRQLGDLHQPVQVDAGLDAHFLAEEHHVFGADIARRAASAMAGEWTAAEAGDRGVELVTPISNAA